MENATEVTGMLIKDKLLDAEPEDFSQIVQSTADASFHTVLEALIEYDTDLAVLVTDAKGAVLYSVGQEVTSSTASAVLPTEVSDTILESDSFSGPLTEEFCGERLWMYAVGVYNANGELCGMVAACSTEIRWGTAIEGLTKTIITSAF